jgi:hypothetical protein
MVIQRSSVASWSPVLPSKRAYPQALYAAEGHLRLVMLGRPIDLASPGVAAPR